MPLPYRYPCRYNAAKGLLLWQDVGDTEIANAGSGKSTPALVPEDAGRTAIEPVRCAGYELNKLLAGTAADDLHPEADFGPAVGREAINTAAQHRPPSGLISATQSACAIQRD